jgi:FkbM family methyltransferase
MAQHNSTTDFWPQVEAAAHALAARVTAAKAACATGLALAGAGFHGEATAKWLRAQGAVLDCFLDNHPAKQGTQCAGLPVVPVDVFSARNASFVLITARHAVKAVEAQLVAAGIPCLSYDAFFVCEHLARLKQMRDTLLSDARSREVLDHLLLTMLTGDREHCRAVTEGNQYFALPEFINVGTDHFVDAGAFVGDTVEKFIWVNNGVFPKIYAFEPGPKQQAAIAVRVKRLASEWAFDADKVEAVQAGLGAAESEFHLFTPAGALQGTILEASTARGQTTKVPVVTLDGFLAGRPVGYLKSDIEGMELEMLSGAQNSIRTHRPKLAISIYHKPEDLFLVAEYIAKLVPEYRMAIRQHSPLLMDTVLYCWLP